MKVLLTKARRVLGWTARLGLDDAVRSALEWAQRRPEVLGYE